MSVQALFAAFKIKCGGPSEKLVLLVLADHADDKFECFPSQETLASRTGLSPKTVWRCLQSLTDRGLITRRHRSRPDGTKSTDVFTLVFAADPVVKLTRGTNRHRVQNQSSLCPKPVVTMTTLNLPLEPSKVNLRARPTLKVVGERELKAVPFSGDPLPRGEAKRLFEDLTKQLAASKKPPVLKRAR